MEQKSQGPKPMKPNSPVTPGSPTRSGKIPDQGDRRYPKVS